MVRFLRFFLFTSIAGYMLLFGAQTAHAASRFWVGGTADWDATAGTKWALTSGGAGGQAVPTTADAVFFDAASGTNTITITATANAASVDGTGATATLAGSSALNISGTAGWVAGGLTITYSGTMTLNVANGTFSGGGLSYGPVVFAGSGQLTVSGNNTFSALTVTKSGTGNQGLILPASGITTVTGTFTATGGAINSRTFVRSAGVGTASNISAGSVSLTNVTLRDITASGSATPWTGISIGDGGGNMNITVTPAITLYWIATSGGNWSDASSWSSSSAGSAGAIIPLPQDTAIIDANSITSTGRTITVNMTHVGTINLTGVLNSPTFTLSATNQIYGSLTLVAGITLNQSAATSFQTRTNSTLTNAGKSWTLQTTFNMPGGTMTLQDDFASTAVALTAFRLINGTFNANGNNVTALNYNMTGTTTTLLMGSGTWTVAGTVWSLDSSMIVNCGTSTLKFTEATSATKTITPAGQTHNIIWLSGTGTGPFAIVSSLSAATLKIDTPPHTVQFTTGIIVTISALDANGTSGNVNIFQSSIASSPWSLVKTGGGTVIADYVSIQDSQASPGSTWYATQNSVNVGNNSGWTFCTEATCPPVAGSSTPTGQLSTNLVIVGGPLTASNFSLFLDGSQMDAGTVYTRSTGTHMISQTPVTNYSTTFGTDCDAQGNITVSSGGTATCTVTNTYGAGSPMPTPQPTPTPQDTPTSHGFTTLAALGLKEGDTVSATNSDDPDIYIPNIWGYKRLFLNPIIFSFYGHLGGFGNVKTVPPVTRNILVTSSLLRNCETNDPKVYAVEVTGEDEGILHWINVSGDQAVLQDPDFFHKVFCINSNEFNWYPKGNEYTSLAKVPVYQR